MREVVNQFIGIMTTMRVMVRRLFTSVNIPGSRSPSRSGDSVSLEYPPARGNDNENDDILDFWAENFPEELSGTVDAMEKQLDLIATTIQWVHDHPDMDTRMSTYEGELSTYTARRASRSAMEELREATRQLQDHVVFFQAAHQAQSEISHSSDVMELPGKFAMVPQISRQSTLKCLMPEAFHCVRNSVLFK